jgi:CBS domain-containing protein
MDEVTVASVTTTRLVTAAPDTPFRELVATMIQKGISELPVVDGDSRPFGVVSDAGVFANRSSTVAVTSSRTGIVSAETGGTARRGRTRRGHDHPGTCGARRRVAPRVRDGTGRGRVPRARPGVVAVRNNVRYEMYDTVTIPL